MKILKKTIAQSLALLVLLGQISLPVCAVGEDKLLEAVSQGKIDDVKACLECEGLNVNYEDENGNTALTLAIQSKYLYLIGILLDHGADPTMQMKNGSAPIDIAISAIDNADLRPADIILQKYEPKDQDTIYRMLLNASNKNTPPCVLQMLIYKYKSKNMDVLRYAFKKAVNNENYDLATGLLSSYVISDEATMGEALCTAIKNKKIRLIEELLKYKIIEGYGVSGEELNLAISTNNPDIVRLLLPHAYARGTTVQKEALLKAIDVQNLDILRLLLKHTSKNIDYREMIFQAICKDDRDILELLLKHIGKSVDYNEAVDQAIRERRFKVLPLLLEHADESIEDYQYILNHAMYWGDMELLKISLEHSRGRIDQNAALFQAIDTRDLMSLQLILQLNVINQETKDKALQLVVKQATDKDSSVKAELRLIYTCMVLTLLKYGANPNHPNFSFSSFDGYNELLHSAVCSGNMEIVAALLKAGISPRCIGFAMETAKRSGQKAIFDELNLYNKLLHSASCVGNVEIVTALLKAGMPLRCINFALETAKKADPKTIFDKLNLFI